MSMRTQAAHESDVGDHVVDFTTAAAASLRDLQQRVGLEGWWVLRRNDHEHVVLAAIDDVFGQGPGTVVSWEDSFCRLTVEQGAPPVATDIDLVPCYAQARARNGIPARSLIVVPLTAPDGRLIGILRALGTQVRPNLGQYLPTVQVAAALLGVLLSHELELAEQVSRATRAEGAAHTDALTGIGNRRAWDAAIAGEEARCARHADQAAVIVLDVNGLKVLNDTQGHHAGDQLLVTTAAVIAERVRPSDVVARVGGDEFAVLLPRTDVGGAWVLARDLQRSLRAAGTSVSMGVAGRSSRSGLAEAWHQADAAMYADKSASRQRLRAMGSSSPPAELGSSTAGTAGPAAAAALPVPRSSPDADSAAAGETAAQAAAAGVVDLPVAHQDPQGLLGGALRAALRAASVEPLSEAPSRAPSEAFWEASTPDVVQVVADASGGGAVTELLDLIRRQLGAQVAYVSVFADGQRRLRNVVATIDLPMAAGDLITREASPSWYVATGRAPAVSADVTLEPALARLPDVAAWGVRSFAGVALRTPDPMGRERVYGSLCVFSQHPDPDLSERDVRVLEEVTAPLVRLIQAEEAERVAHHQVLERLDRLRATDGLQMHFQSVVDLHTGDVLGAEALARFPGTGQRPDEWFAMAAAAGAGTDLELQAVRAALPALDHAGYTGYLAVNLSPQTACAPALARLLRGVPLERVVVEITEHEEVTDYAQIRDALAPLRAGGLRLAVDDTGAGYASMRHVLALVPDLIKLDISLVRDIHTDPARRALAAALTTFATATGAEVIAEGIETAEELACLRGLGVHCGQGYHLSRPAPLGAVMTPLR